MAERSRLNMAGSGADTTGMKIDHDSAAVPTAHADAAVADVTALLPTREALLDRMGEQLDDGVGRPATLMLIGLLRRDDGWPTPADALAQVTTCLARSLRGEDWLAASGPAEFAVVLDGDVPAAEIAASRVLARIDDLGIEGLSAAAGIAALADDLRPTEIHRRAMVSLTAARGMGPGSVVPYRAPVGLPNR